MGPTVAVPSLRMRMTAAASRTLGMTVKSAMFLPLLRYSQIC